MIRIASLFDRGAANAAQGIPPERMDRLRGSFRRRLSDALEEVLHRACVENDLRTATALYAVLEDLHRRSQGKHGHDRRFSDEPLVHARAELERCREINRREQPAARQPAAI